MQHEIIQRLLSCISIQRRRPGIGVVGIYGIGGKGYYSILGRGRGRVRESINNRDHSSSLLLLLDDLVSSGCRAVHGRALVLLGLSISGLSVPLCGRFSIIVVSSSPSSSSSSHSSLPSSLTRASIVGAVVALLAVLRTLRALLGSLRLLESLLPRQTVHVLVVCISSRSSSSIPSPLSSSLHRSN
ncbi:hypothetical protein PFISCL1PPCAC_22765, partial [Pristionchus fissidentatus]